MGHSVVDVGGVAEPFLTQGLHTQRRVRKAAMDKKCPENAKIKGTLLLRETKKNSQSMVLMARPQ